MQDGQSTSLGVAGLLASGCISVSAGGGVGLGFKGLYMGARRGFQIFKDLILEFSTEQNHINLSQEGACDPSPDIQDHEATNIHPQTTKK